MNSYFSHDSNARNDEKIIRLRMKHGAAGYGVYFMLLERMREEANYMCAADYEMIAFDLRVDKELVKAVVEDFGLFALTDDHQSFYSRSFMNRMQQKDVKSEKLSEAGKRGMQKRWNKKDNEVITNDTKKDNEVITTLPKTDNKKRKVKKSKVKKSKEKEKKEEREGTKVPTTPPSPNGISFEKFSEWLKKNAPEMLQLKPPTERTWLEVKILYQTPKALAKACEEIAANDAFRTKWKYFSVALRKWNEQERRLGIKS